MLAPGLREVGRGDASGEGRTPEPQRNAVEVAAILGRQPVDERRAPDRREARALRQRRDAVEARGDEDRLAGFVRGDVVDVDVAGGVAGHRHHHRVVAVLGRPRLEVILETPKLVERGHPECALGADAHPHAAGKAALEDREPTVGLEADQEELAGLVGGEGEARFGGREPRDKKPRGGDLNLRWGVCHFCSIPPNLRSRAVRWVLSHPLPVLARDCLWRTPRHWRLDAGGLRRPRARWRRVASDGTFVAGGSIVTLAAVIVRSQSRDLPGESRPRVRQRRNAARDSRTTT